MLKGFVLLLLAAAFAAPAAAGPPADGVWVNGSVHNLVVTGPASASAHAIPLYVIAPVSAAHPLHPLADAKTHGFGAHDHVIALTHPNNTYHGACDLTLVVPGPKATAGKTIQTRPTLTPAGIKPLLYAARLAQQTAPAHLRNQNPDRQTPPPRNPDRHPQPRRLHRLTTPHPLVASGSRYEIANRRKTMRVALLVSLAAAIGVCAAVANATTTRSECALRSKTIKGHKAVVYCGPATASLHIGRQDVHVQERHLHLVRRPDPHTRNPGQRRARLGKQRRSAAHPTVGLNRNRNRLRLLRTHSTSG